MFVIAKNEPNRLLVDSMLGRLARWLRLLGYDTIYAAEWSDYQIMARARAQGRTVITRDRELSRRKGIRCLLVQSHHLEEQLGEVLIALGGPPAQVPPRCPQCNAVLVEVEPALVRAHVPAFILKTHHRFRYCSQCCKYYWEGSHWQRIQSVIERVLERIAGPFSPGTSPGLQGGPERGVGEQ